MYIIGTQRQYEKFYEELKAKVPVPVMALLRERVQILDEFYGENRNIEHDMGGFCAVITASEIREEEHQALLNQYYIQEEQYEYRDWICVGENGWTEELYLTNSDYGIICFRPGIKSVEGEE